MKNITKTIKTLYLLVPLTFLTSNVSYAGFGEQSWYFYKSERISYYVPHDPSNPVGTNGVIFGCEQFQPSQISLLIFYAGEPPIHENNTDAIIQKKILRPASPNGNERGFIMLRDVKKLAITFLYGTKYHISNLTGTEFFGINCDTGDTFYQKN